MPHTSLCGESQTAAGQKEDQAAMDGQQKEVRCVPHVLVRGWKSPLAMEMYQAAATGKKKQAAVTHVSSCGVIQTAAGHKSGPDRRFPPTMKMRPSDHGQT